jgi:hypothetical protein
MAVRGLWDIFQCSVGEECSDGGTRLGQLLGCGVIEGSVKWLLLAFHSSFSDCGIFYVATDSRLIEAIGYVGQSRMDKRHYLKKRKRFNTLRIVGSGESYGC